jgi:hypothetical protein
MLQIDNRHEGEAPKHENRLVNMAIECCADDITQLRLCDVDRALDTASANGSYLDTIEFIAMWRPDLMPRVVEHKS